MNLIPRRRRDLPAARNEFDRTLSRFFDDDEFGLHLPEFFRQPMFPNVNVAETEGALEITAELPGMDEKDIDVQVMGNHLVISGERKWEEEKKSKEFHRVESEFGSFRREIPLPGNLRLNADDINASYKKGVLKIAVPKVEPTPASKIPIKAG